MSKLELNFLGIFTVALDAVPITTFESNKVRALLTYLAVESQRPHAREVLAALLWPDWPDSAARSNLRYALADLRKAIQDQQADPPFLLISRDAIQFNPASDYFLDAADIAALAAFTGAVDDIERLERVVALYQGEFLEGFSVGDAAPFEDWTRLKREQLHRAYQHGLNRLTVILEDYGDLMRALGYARRMVEVEPMDESGQRQLMRLLALSGRRTEALAQYATCREVLQKELQAEPSSETAQLYEQILAGKLGAGTPAFYTIDQPTTPVMLDAFKEGERPVFAAREQELVQLKNLLQGMLNGNGRLAFVTGDAGCGKTALLREFARQASEAHPDLLVVAGTCNPYSGVGDPYLPLRSVLRILMGNLEIAGSTGMMNRDQALRLWKALPGSIQILIDRGFYLIDSFLPGHELLSLVEAGGFPQTGLRQIIEQASNQSSKLAQEHLFEQYCSVLRAISRDYPLLILLDDLQWVDSASAGLLYHLGTRLEGSHILVLCTYRPEEVALSANGERHPLDKALAEFKRLYGDAWLDLSYSDENEGRHFIDILLDSEHNRLGKTFRQLLFQRTEGHALFTIELLRTMQERGNLVQDGEGFWIEGSTLEWRSLPARVEAVIGERVERLEQALRETVSIASVEGKDFTVQVVARVRQVSELRLLHDLSQELEKRHHLVHEQGELQIARQTLWRFRFAHTLYQQYLYNHLSSAERRHLHRTTAQVLEELYAECAAEIAPQLAYHWQQAKDISKAREYMLVSGQAALAAYANLEAETYFRQALELEPTDVQRAVMMAELGEALRRQAQREAAVQVLREAINLYRHIGDPDEMARLYSNLSLVLWQDNKLDAWNACQEGLEQLVDVPDSRGMAHLLAEAGRTAHFMQNALAESLCRRAIEMAERLGILEAQAEATITLAMIMDDVHGKYTESIQMLEQIIPFCETHNLWRSAVRAHSNLGVWQYMYDIDIYSSFQHTFQGAKLSAQIGDIDLMFWCLDLAAEASYNLGYLTSVENMLSEFLQQSTASKERIGLFLEDVSNGLLFYRGDWVQAREYHHTNLSIYRNQKDLEGIATANYKLALDQVELYCLTGLGNLSDAEAILLENLEYKEWPQLTTSLLVKVFSLQNRFSEAHALMVELFKATPVYRLSAKACHAMAERRWNQAASVTLSLITLLQTIGRRWDWARALIDLGDIYVQRNKPGDLKRAQKAYQQSLDIFSEMEATGYIQVLEKRLEILPI